MSEKGIVHKLDLENERKAVISVVEDRVCVELIDPSKELTCVNYLSLNDAKKLGQLLSSL